MTSVRIRPRFRLHSSESIANIQQNIHDKLKVDGSPCIGVIVPGFITLKIPTLERHFWSPQLTLTLEKEDDKTLIRGLYGPNPTVWAIFTMGYGATGILALFAAVLGLSQLTLKSSPWGLWILPGLVVVAAILYFASQTGQKLGVEQTFTIHHFLEESLGEKIHIV